MRRPPIATRVNTLSPYTTLVRSALKAAHVLLFQSESSAGAGSRKGPGSFFHTMAGPLALAEHLVARFAAKGGQAVLNRLDEVELRLREELAYWRPRGKSQ